MKIEQPFLKSFSFALVAFVVFAVKIAITDSENIPEKTGAALWTCLFPGVLAGLFWRCASFGPKGGAWFWIGATYAFLFFGLVGCQVVRGVQ